MCAGLKYYWLNIPDHNHVSMTGVLMGVPRGGLSETVEKCSHSPGPWEFCIIIIIIIILYLWKESCSSTITSGLGSYMTGILLDILSHTSHGSKFVFSSSSLLCLSCGAITKAYYVRVHVKYFEGHRGPENRPAALCVSQTGGSLSSRPVNDGQDQQAQVGE